MSDASTAGANRPPFSDAAEELLRLPLMGGECVLFADGGRQWIAVDGSLLDAITVAKDGGAGLDALSLVLGALTPPA